MAESQRTKFILSNSSRLRVKLSYHAIDTLRDDMLSFGFGEDGLNDFCNYVFAKYYTKAKATISYRLTEAKEKYENLLRLALRLGKTRESAINALLMKNEQEEVYKSFVQEQNEKNRGMKNNNKGEVFLYLNAGNREIIRELNGEKEKPVEKKEEKDNKTTGSSETEKDGKVNTATDTEKPKEDDKDKKEKETKDKKDSYEIKKEYCYHKDLKGYISEIIEEYAMLSHYEREKIVRSDEIDFLGKYLQIKKDAVKGIIRINSNGAIYNFIPYKFVSDPLKTRQYIVGYSYEMGQTEDQKRTASFAVGRLQYKNLSEYTRKRVELTKREMLELEDLIKKDKMAYMLGEVKQIKIRLTPEGVIKYRNIITSRPAAESRIKDVTPGHEKDMIYTFRCTYRQIENYFLTFCDSAEILEPADLKMIFREHYEKAFKLYDTK